MELTTLDALLIFLVSRKGQTGYDIRQLFQSSPVSQFSDSPGAIYPALARLERRGLIASVLVPGGRRRRVYQCADAGARALGDWLAAPIDPAVLDRRPQDYDLHFVLVAETQGAGAAQRFLIDYARALEAGQARLAAYLAGAGATLSQASRQAVTLGMKITEARLAWCHEHAATLKEPR